MASWVPERPSKLRLKLRMETAPVEGAWPMPMQGPQADSMMRAPEAMMSAKAPFLAIISKTCLEPGVTVMETLGCTCFPLSILATIMRSE